MLAWIGLALGPSPIKFVSDPDAFGPEIVLACVYDGCRADRGHLHDQAAGSRHLDAFAQLAEKHNGVWSGCWCTWFHPRRKDQGLLDVEPGRPYKELLVREGRAHAALVSDGEAAVAWCEYGTPEELPNIYHRKEYEAGLEEAPDYRLTCFFVDLDYRRKGSPPWRSRGLWS
jgi:hypothetical protein